MIAGLFMGNRIIESGNSSTSWYVCLNGASKSQLEKHAKGQARQPQAYSDVHYFRENESHGE